MKREASRNGIRLILLKNGAKSYEARIHRNGHQFSECFPTRAAALAWKRGIEADFDKGKRIVKKGKLLIKDIIDSYLAYRDPETNKSNPISYNKKLDCLRVRLDLGDFTLDKLTNQDVENYINC